MTENDCLSKMISPGMKRAGKWGGGGVIQILVTSSCDRACLNCTQMSQLQRPFYSMSPDHFEQALQSLTTYWGVVGLFGGNPALSKFFFEYCDLLEKYIPKHQRGIWCNNPLTLAKAKRMREVFNPSVSNLNCHLDMDAYQMFKEGWPESHPFGHDRDSRHSPPFVAMVDVVKKDCGCAMDDTCSYCNNTRSVPDESRIWKLISKCDINQHWSAGLGVFRGQLRGYFCEIAMAQSIYHQDNPDYPDTGLDVTKDYGYGAGVAREFKWWELRMPAFSQQVRKHCFECSVPLQGYGELAQDDTTICPRCEGTGLYAKIGEEEKPCIVCEGKGGIGANGQGVHLPREQVSKIHLANYKPKRVGRRVELVTVEAQLGKRLELMTDYLGNSKR